MRKMLLYTLPTILTLLVLGYCLFQISKSRTFQFFGTITPRVEATEKIVALTFDDGPTHYTSEVLDILKQKNIQATFYVIGQNLEKNPEIGKRIVAEGHELGNHSFSHQRFLIKSQSFIAREIQTTNSLIREAGYQGTITFRPPYGKKLFGLPWYLQKHNIETVMCDVEPDTYGTSTPFLLEYTTQNARPGSIILIHPHCEKCNNAREALPVIIDTLKEQGYVFVTVSDLLSRKQ